MVDRRRKDVDWYVTSQDGSVASVEYIQLAVLLDIRDELKGIRRRLDCPMFMNIPNTLADIRRNTAKRKRKKANAAR